MTARDFQYSQAWFLFLAVLAVWAATVPGCSSIRCKSVWLEGGKGCALVAKPHFMASNALAMARSRYQRGEIEACRSSRDCVDEFYSAAVWAWQAGGVEPNSSAQKLLNQSLARLLREGQARGCLDLQRGLEVQHAGEKRCVAVECIGFEWSREDFHELRVVGPYFQKSLSHYQTSDGLGVPVVILRRKPEATPHTTDFLPRTAAFAATAVITPDGSTLRLYDPLRIPSDAIEGCEIQLARDTTADLAYSVHYHPQTRIEDFLRPDSSRDPSLLYFLEPYQPDKVPVILVHGLLSSPDAWVNVINDLRTYPEIANTYQFWAFKYSTGAPFIRSAAELRSQLDAVLERYGGEGEGHKLHQSVMIGHSMGGLISKLAIAHSGEQLWDSISYIPLESIAADEAMRTRLAERLYFDPHPMVARTIFIATPHRGSITAGRACGRLASALVNDNDSAFESLIQDNIGVFKDSVASGLPTSIDMLEPRQPFLDTISRLRLNPCVPKHTILGDKFHVVGYHPSDGVVSVSSAQHPESVSEKRIAASHNGLLRSPETVHELLRILRLHTSESQSIPSEQ
ncbi:MAG: esterase/lipase family protein [Planctomycetota bacterium]